MAERGDFYEDDEPLDYLLAAFDHGTAVETKYPEHGWGKTIHVAAVHGDPDLELSSVGNATVD